MQDGKDSGIFKGPSQALALGTEFGVGGCMLWGWRQVIALSRVTSVPRDLKFSFDESLNMPCLFALDLNPMHWPPSLVCLPLVSNFGPVVAAFSLHGDESAVDNAYFCMPSV